MIRSSEDNSASTSALPRPVVKKMRWPFPIIWIVPIGAAVVAGWYMYTHVQELGPQIAVTFNEVEGIQPGDTTVRYRGVEVGKVTALELSSDHRRAVARVRLKKSDDVFAKAGASFWIVRPEITADNIAGLSTIITGPYIQALPGEGSPSSEFTGLDHAPYTVQNEGLRIVLHAAAIEHLQRESPVYYRGFQVGVVEDIELARVAAHVDVHAVIWPRYAPLLRTNSCFWALSGAEVKGGVFTGLEVKVGSLRSLLVGAVAFATPDQKTGDLARSGEEYMLNPEPKSEWLKWTPRILLDPNLPAGPDDDNGNDNGIQHDVKPLRPAIGAN